ncbi:FecR domain-containing protein [Chitinophaga vietnamensis]|uniref:FecR domain-containing protein n=1 Tax=Chitinophaga vietnamensis TaxID=2593957 RepID=UPI0011784526|nr:FecR domain-containing protein [Chitinophaga vietnamensis]
MLHPEEYYQQLLQKYLAGTVTPAEAAELFDWLQSDHARKPLLAAMRQDFDQVMQGTHQAPEAMSNRIETKLLQEISREKVAPMRRRKWLAAAAVAALVTVAAAFFFTARQTKAPALAQNTTTDITPGTNKAVLTLADGSTVTLDSVGNQVIQQGHTIVQQNKGQLQYTANTGDAAAGYNVLAVPRGGQFNVVLPDGSHVWLNAASRLKYPTAFNGNTRTVEMEGQGYFEVKPDQTKPFIVKVNNIAVQVLGTAFDIMAYADEKEQRTTLISGAVKVIAGNTEKYLKPGQQAMMDKETGALLVREADVQEVTAWKTGFFEFDNAGLSTILRQLSRWYDVDIQYKAGSSARLFGGRISRNLPLSDILHMLESTGANFKLEDRKLIVTTK